MATVTSEKDMWLALGEKLRENPRTIFLSIPVLGSALLWSKITGDREREAGASGHLGLLFRLYYKHRWKFQPLLKIAYLLFANAARIGTGNGQPSVRMAMGGVALEMGDLDSARKNYEEGTALAIRAKDTNQAAFLRSHLGLIKTRQGQLASAQKDIAASLKTLSPAVKKSPNSLYLQVWISNAELAISEWYLAVGDKKKARVWANQVADRADKYDLRTRRLDAQKLLQKISAVTLLVLSQYPRAMISIGTLVNIHLQA